MHELLTNKDIERIFKPIYYTYIPIEYISNVSLSYYSGETKRYTKQQIENAIRRRYNDHDGYVRIVELYDDEDIQMTEINIDFRKIANHINNSLVRILDEHGRYRTK